MVLDSLETLRSVLPFSEILRLVQAVQYKLLNTYPVFSFLNVQCLRVKEEAEVYSNELANAVVSIELSASEEPVEQAAIASALSN